VTYLLTWLDLAFSNSCPSDLFDSFCPESRRSKECDVSAVCLLESVSGSRMDGARGWSCLFWGQCFDTVGWQEGQPACKKLVPVILRVSVSEKS